MTALQHVQLSAKPQTDNLGFVPVVTAIAGDGIGPEIMAATQRLIAAAGVKIEWDNCEAGGAVFAKGIASGVPQATLDSIGRTGLALKGPLATPIGGGGKSANVTLRKYFETYGNIRPARELPGIATPFAGHGIDLVVVRENVEDLYAGIEHMQTADVAQCLKLVSRPGCENIVRLAFELARAEGRKSVHCATKANIMKLTEGLMQKVFEEIAKDYPEIAAEHILVDNCAHKLVRSPERFETIVTTNMNGDILSDLTAGLVGGLGLAPSANIGNEVAIFEAVHGSAPDIAGKGIANPTALMLSAVMLLRHLGAFGAATKVEGAILRTLEEGLFLTGDIAGQRPAASTEAFTEAVIDHLGAMPLSTGLRESKALKVPVKAPKLPATPAAPKQVDGVDVFVESAGPADAIGATLEAVAVDTAFRLAMVSNRGTKLYPPTGAKSETVNHWRCRFMLKAANGSAGDAQIAQLLHGIGAKLSWMHVEKLQSFGGQRGYSMAQGEN